MKRCELTGQRFGMLTVIGYDHTDKGKNAVWLCKCDCGGNALVISKDLRNGHTQSCGCLQRKRASVAKTKHGKSESRIYSVWKNMKARCCDKTNKAYGRYGERGIKICDEWMHDFSTFFNWAMANGYEEHLTIDRKNNDGNYCPENCRWVTFEEQQNNRSTCRYITHNGITKTLTQWAKEIGVPRYSLARYLKRGKTLEEIMGE